jgi:adenine phosphoribosyltransferase
VDRASQAVSVSLEYAEATLEVHQDALQAGDRVLLVDDVLATGGTLAATRTLVERSGGVCTAVAVLMELGFLDGRAAAGDLPVASLMTV